MIGFRISCAAALLASALVAGGELRAQRLYPAPPHRQTAEPPPSVGLSDERRGGWSVRHGIPQHRPRRGPHPPGAHDGFGSGEGPPIAADPPWRRDSFPSTYAPLPRTDTLIVHATILDGDGHRIDDGELLLRDGKVAGIGHGLPRGGARVIDAAGRWVTPGIVDPHSHNGTYVVPLTTIDDKSSDVSEMSDPNAAGTWIETALNPQDAGFTRALARGVTTMQILPGSDPIIGGRSVIVKPIPATTMQAMKFPNAPRGLKMACGENPKKTDAERARGPTSRQGMIEAIRWAFAGARDYMHDWQRHLAGARAAAA